MTTRPFRGTCACGSVSWTSTTPPQHLDYCYCTQCQRISGAPFIAWLGFPLSATHFSTSNSGSLDGIKTFRLLVSDGMDSIATRSCCANCGGTLTMQYDCCKGEKVHIAAGTIVEGELDEGVGRCHIWVREKPRWYRIPEDGVQRWEGFDDEFEEVRRKFERDERREGYHPVREVPGAYEELEELEEGEEDEIVIRRAEAKAREEEGGDGGESDEELRELRRRYGGGSGNKGNEVQVEEYMYDSD